MGLSEDIGLDHILNITIYPFCCGSLCLSCVRSFGRFQLLSSSVVLEIVRDFGVPMKGDKLRVFQDD